ncbi:MAG TPA: pyridoxal-phosphate dependent enzyme [Actinomycetota bacterium]|nr:pyridoxal-phosphate dependent enzyme [Actinomycetota bacterium]
MSHLPRYELGAWPTPVRKLDAVSTALAVDVWAKLEEECGTWGGNKVRKLEYILGRAREDGIRRLGAFGLGTSNWVGAFVYHASKEGFHAEVSLAGPVPHAFRALYERCAVRVHAIPRALLPLYVLRSRYAPDRGGARLLPAGGSGTEGDLGTLGTGREIAAAVLDGSLPEPRRAFVAVGTAGTAAGVALGMAAGGLHVPLVCVRVTPRPYGTVGLVRRRIAALRVAAGLESAPLSPLEADDRFVKPGYGDPNPASLEAAALARSDGLELDGTYAAKAFASLVAHARARAEGPLLFVHTSPGPVP